MENNYKKAFIVSTGRCGTTLLGILFNQSPDVIALNEGELRAENLTGKQYLKALTHENYRVYKNLKLGESVLNEQRVHQIKKVLNEHNKKYYIEIAYYLAPFIQSLYKIFPDSKLVYIYRDGRNFVRSVYTTENPDPMPVGFLDRKPSTLVEKYVAMGRLKPLNNSKYFKEWNELSPFQKNVWLWKETNNLIMKQLKTWPEEQCLRIKMENLLNLDSILNLLKFLEIDDIKKETIKNLLKKKINKRHGKKISHWSAWTNDLRKQFKKIAQDLLKELGYVKNSNW